MGNEGFVIYGNYHRIEVKIDLQKELFLMKVQNRDSYQYDKRLLHFKKKKYCELPDKIKDSFRSLAEFQKYLIKNHSSRVKVIDSCSDKCIEIKLCDQVVRIPFENTERDSRILVDLENAKLKQSTNLINIQIFPIKVTLPSTVQISQNPQQEKLKISHFSFNRLRSILRYIMRRNDRQAIYPPIQLQGDDLIRKIEDEFSLLENSKLKMSPAKRYQDLQELNAKLEEQNKNLQREVLTLKGQVQGLEKLTNYERSEKIRRQIEELFQTKWQILGKQYEEKVNGLENQLTEKQKKIIELETKFQVWKQSQQEYVLRDVWDCMKDTNNNSSVVEVKINFLSKETVLNRIRLMVENNKKLREKIQSKDKSFKEVEDLRQKLKDMEEALKKKNAVYNKQKSDFFVELNDTPTNGEDDDEQG